MFTLSRGGIYYLRTAHVHDPLATSKTQNYSIHLEVVTYPEGVSDDNHDDTGVTLELEDGFAVAFGAIEVMGDGDWFAVKLRKGRTYVIDVLGEAPDHGTLRDPRVLVWNDRAFGAWQAVDNNGGVGANARITLTPRKNGTHYVYVRAKGLETGEYTVTATLSSVSEPRRGDLPADTTTTGLLTPEYPPPPRGY